MNLIFRKVKTNKLSIPEEALETQDSVKPRRDVFAYLKDIVERIDNVAKAEVANAMSTIQKIYDYFGTDDIDEDDIRELASKVKAFYDEINTDMFSVGFYSADPVKKAASQIAKAISDIGEVLDEDDPLTILMTFSGDPLSDLQPLMDLFKQLDTDFEKIEKQLATRKQNLGNIGETESGDTRYADDTDTINACLNALGEEVHA